MSMLFATIGIGIVARVVWAASEVWAAGPREVVDLWGYQIHPTVMKLK